MTCKTWTRGEKSSESRCLQKLTQSTITFLSCRSLRDSRWWYKSVNVVTFSTKDMKKQKDRKITLKLIILLLGISTDWYQNYCPLPRERFDIRFLSHNDFDKLYLIHDVLQRLWKKVNSSMMNFSTYLPTQSSLLTVTEMLLPAFKGIILMSGVIITLRPPSPQKMIWTQDETRILLRIQKELPCILIINLILY